MTAAVAPASRFQPAFAGVSAGIHSRGAAGRPRFRRSQRGLGRPLPAMPATVGVGCPPSLRLTPRPYPGDRARCYHRGNGRNNRPRERKQEAVVPSNIEHRTAADAAPAISRPRLGLSSGSLYPDIATEEVPAVAARLGLPDIELMLQTAGEYDPAFMREVARNCRAAGCRVHAIHVMQSLHPVFDPYPRRVREGRALFARAIEGAAALGARALVWHGPRQEELRTPERWARFIEIAAELAEECGAVGVTLALENVSWCALPTVRDVAAFAARMEELRTTHVGFAFDPFQAAEAGANPFMILAAMEGRVADVHLSDWREHDPAARHLPPGEGDLPWPALLRAIVGSGYRGPLLIEAAIGDEPDTIRRVQERLTPLLALATAGAPDARCGGEPPPGVREGIRLFNAREFYECHEVIEHEWHAERGEIR